MAEINQSMVKTVNVYQSRINVVKFDGTNNWKGNKDNGKFKLVIVNWERISVLIVKRKETENLIISSPRRRIQNQRLISQNLMIVFLTHLYVHFLSLLLFAIQRNVSGFCVRALPITFVPSWSDLLVLKK